MLRIARAVLPSILVMLIAGAAIAQPAEPDAADDSPGGSAYSTVEVVLGCAVGTFVGLGIGHAVQGRYGGRGWIFTVGELGAAGAAVGGMAACAESPDRCTSGIALGGAIAFVALRALEVADTCATPVRHNRRIEARRRRAARVAPYLENADRGAVVGVSLTF